MSDPLSGSNSSHIGDVHGPALTGTFTGQVNIGAPAPRPEGVAAFQVPYPPNALFTGRVAELAQLATFLQTEAPVMVSPAIAGMGGVGKTQLAAEFARRHQADFPGGIFWLNMEQPATIAGQVAACAGPGGLDLLGYGSMTPDEQITRVRAAWQQPIRRLLVFDNLEDPALLRQWQPHGGGSRVLITTRREIWPGGMVKRLALQTLPRPESCILLLASRAEDQGREVAKLLVEPQSSQDANAICESLGDLPLALAIAGAYLKNNPFATLAAYRKRVTPDPLALERSEDPQLRELLIEAGLATGRTRGVIATLDVSYQQLASNNLTDALAREILHAAAFCAPEPIPVALLLRVVELDLFEESDAARGSQALNRLRTVGLVTWDGGAILQLHRLVAAYVRGQVEQAAVQLPLLKALAQEANRIRDSGFPREALAYVPHLYIAKYWVLDDEVLYSKLLYSLAQLVNFAGVYPQAHKLFEQVLAIQERALGLEHPDTLSTYQNMAWVLIAQGRQEQACRLFEQVLAIQKRVLGPKHRDTLTTHAWLTRVRGNMDASS